MFFRNWSGIVHMVIVATITYVVVVLALRLFGARALARMSGYDLIVTVALGSLVANIPFTTSLSTSDGLTVILTFLVLQEITRRLQSRFRWVHRTVRERPAVVVWNGEFLPLNLRHDGLSEDEVRAAIRRAGFISLMQVQAVILENDGDWSVIPRSDAPDVSALEGLRLPYTLPPGADPAGWRPGADVGGDAHQARAAGGGGSATV